MDLKKTLACSLIALGSVVALTLSSTKVYAASGVVESYVASEPIVGLWIEVEGGGSGWAHLNNRGLQKTGWSYNTHGRRFKAHIGVGGTPQKWGRTCITGWKNDANGLLLQAYGYPGAPWISWTN